MVEFGVQIPMAPFDLPFRNAFPSKILSKTQGYLRDLSKPIPNPTLKEIGEPFFATRNIKRNWMTKCRSYWAAFCEVVEVEIASAPDEPMMTAYKDGFEVWRHEGG